MRKHHPENERIKRRYVGYLKHAKQLSDASIDQTVAAIADFEAVTNYRDFRKHRIELAQKYKRVLGDRLVKRTGRPLAKATISSRLMALKAFFEWLAGQPGFRSKLTYTDALYFRQSANDDRIAKAVRAKPIATVEEIHQVLVALPNVTDIEKRDRALIAFALLSGARDDAIASFSLKHVDLNSRTVFHDARDVRTKNRKTFTTSFFPVGREIEDCVATWVHFLMEEREFGPDDPFFPATKIALGDNGFEVDGLLRKHWRDAAPIRRIFKRAFTRAGLPYVNPHSLRNTLVTLGERLCTSAETFKAWSQNLGHEHVLTTFTSYGTVTDHRRAQIFDQLRSEGLSSSQASESLDDETIAKVMALLSSRKAA